ncbi:hypothetical protein H4Q26_004112 [Puccinia striiformis f. sp. tritici PST-130]|nr:hypothetical protein H4Q26_004112 [Puccinia striiformis f. sp. tritici PST-130]
MACPAVHIEIMAVFTFLHADSTRGSLQVYVAREEGGHGQEPEYHWIEANPVEGAFGNPTSLSIIISEFENLGDDSCVVFYVRLYSGQYRRNVGDMDQRAL